MKQLLIEKTKSDVAKNKTHLLECSEFPACPGCKQKLTFQENLIFTQKVNWTCDNDKCTENSFMRIRMGNKYFLIKL